MFRATWCVTTSGLGLIINWNLTPPPPEHENTSWQSFLFGNVRKLIRHIYDVELGFDPAKSPIGSFANLAT
jgi:hypothetical protein